MLVWYTDGKADVRVLKKTTKLYLDYIDKENWKKKYN